MNGNWGNFDEEWKERTNNETWVNLTWSLQTRWRRPQDTFVRAVSVEGRVGVSLVFFVFRFSHLSSLGKKRKKKTKRGRRRRKQNLTVSTVLHYKKRSILYGFEQTYTGTEHIRSANCITCLTVWVRKPSVHKEGCVAVYRGESDLVTSGTSYRQSQVMNQVSYDSPQSPSCQTVMTSVYCTWVNRSTLVYSFSRIAMEELHVWYFSTTLAWNSSRLTLATGMGFSPDLPYPSPGPIISGKSFWMQISNTGLQKSEYLLELKAVVTSLTSTSPEREWKVWN